MRRLLISAGKLLAFIAVAVGLIFPTSSSAAPYGSGDYGDCPYETGCADTGSGSDSGSSSGSGSKKVTQSTEEPSADPSNTVVLNTFADFFTSTGKTIDALKVNDVIVFCTGAKTISNDCDSTDANYHTALVKSIDLTDPNNPVVTLTISSTPTDYTFTTGQTKDIDADHDGTDDVTIKLNYVSNGQANFTFKTVKSATTQTSDDNNEVDEPTDDKSGSSWIWWLAGGVGLAVVLWLIFKKKETNHNG